MGHTAHFGDEEYVKFGSVENSEDTRVEPLIILK